MDGESLDVEPGSFDAAISRLGLMYLPDKQGRSTQRGRALRAGGRYAAIVFAEPERNRFFSVPISIIRRSAELPPPAPGPAGAVLGHRTSASCSRRRLPRGRGAPASRRRSGSRRRPSAPSSSGSRSARCTRCSPSLDQPAREATWAEIEAALEEFEGADGFTGPCELLVGAGTK